MPPPSVAEVLSIPTRWGGITNGANSIAQYLAGQQTKKQDLQYNLANQLINAQALSMAYGGSQNPTIASMLENNPYGKGLFPNVPTQGTTTPVSGMPPTINANGMFGLGGGIGYGMSTPAPAMGGQFNPLNSTSPASGDNVTTGSSMEFKPFVGMVPSKVDVQNIPGQSKLAAAKSYAEKSGGAQQGAQEGEARDIQQLAMVKNAIKPLVESYDQVYNSNVLGGLPGAGDIYGSAVVKNANWIPRKFQGAVPSETQNYAGQFLANKNELVTKLQPLLSQQFGKEGSSRIMEKLVDMSQQEIGDLSTPRDQFHGQITGTMSSLYRIAKASQAYAKDLAESGQSMPNPDTAAQEISRRMSMQDLSPKEQKELQGMIDDVLGKKELPKSADFNPVSKSGDKEGQQSNQDIRTKYNQLRASGVSKEDAKKQLGLR